MTDIQNAKKLLYGTLYDTASDVWKDELSNGTTVSFSSSITVIKYTLLTSIPDYYVGTKEDSANVLLSNSFALSDSIKTVLGQNTKNGFEVYFNDVANVIFDNQAQSGNNVGAITISGFDRDYYQTQYDTAIDQDTNDALEGKNKAAVNAAIRVRRIYTFIGYPFVVLEILRNALPIVH